MKTIRITAITTILSLAASSSLWAAPPGKHPTEKIPHRHSTQEATKADMNDTMLKRIGPRGKGFIRSRSYRN